MNPKVILRGVAEAIAPGLLHRRRIRRLTRREADLQLLPLLANRQSISVDVGANMGLYVDHLVGLSRQVVAFEPVPEMHATLARYYPHIRLENIALSDENGEAAIRMPHGLTALATLESSNQFSLPVETVTFHVSKRTLDSYDLEGVGFIKIDVEGHEESVLRGALETIARERPNIMAELEDRHNVGMVDRVRSMMADLSYRGYFWDAGKLAGMEAFNAATDQMPENVGSDGKIGRYINNFIFLPAERSQDFEGRAAAIGAA